jgi:tRNA(adenine34) deaminase
MMSDRDMMARCIALAKESRKLHEYPYAAVICRRGSFVCESLNRVSRDGDVTRHAELVAISEAQRQLETTSLDDCTIYMNAEPCALCSYAIRESRMARVVYALHSPIMGGQSRWNILDDHRLHDSMPEVFAPPPEILMGFMQDEAEAGFRSSLPLIWHFIVARGLFVRGSVRRIEGRGREGSWQRLLMLLRRNVVDWVGRRRMLAASLTEESQQRSP